jgi:hypothetical protein
MELEEEVRMKTDQKQSTIEKLKLKKEQLHARIKKMENREKYKTRKLDARKKMLVGAYFLEKADQEGTMAALVELMDQYLKRKADRNLFDLPPLVAEEE